MAMRSPISALLARQIEQTQLRLLAVDHNIGIIEAQRAQLAKFRHLLGEEHSADLATMDADYARILTLREEIAADIKRLQSGR